MVLQSSMISKNVPVLQQLLQVHSLAVPTKQPLKEKTKKPNPYYALNCKEYCKYSKIFYKEQSIS